MPGTSGKESAPAKKRPVAQSVRAVVGGLASPVRGGRLGLKAAQTPALIDEVRAGFHFNSLARFQESSGLSMEQIARVAEIPKRTLVRRKAAGRLSKAESERLLRLALIFDKAVALFEGDLAAARGWLERPNKALGEESPLSALETEIGGREVEDLIGRLEHGVFS